MNFKESLTVKIEKMDQNSHHIPLRALFQDKEQYPILKLIFMDFFYKIKIYSLRFCIVMGPVIVHI